ncbi:branched-chain amino acid ABC transporter permease [Deinococcus maricopensis]|uniref:ABC-type transporter, integral membrane subunit n=1 Tax=Deinococcus maricopensis (strain DSM 21211 / LMG 22137 / NRRL B-23946 / LB-34) TaxID=709986 RepID=E8UAF8_DEIML|nr:branched-chain amino acid ABC transporter permease [Deinococcus maricopensis]ADV68047.1 ABC-type transporter, integral membrane subunit [Deinococcus maricopensis DSM 21211]
MTAAPTQARRRQDMTLPLLLLAAVTSLVLIISQHGDVLARLGGLGTFLGNPLVRAVVLSLFLANLLFAYRWRTQPWAKVLVGAACLLLVLPWAGRDNTSLFDTAIQIGIFAALALGLNIVVGLAGLLDLGYVAFFAVGAYMWGIFGSGQIATILKYYGEHAGATNAGTLVIGLLLTVITAASMLFIRRAGKGRAPSRASSISFGLASFGLVAGLTLTGRALLVLNAAKAQGLATGLDAGFFWLFLALSIFAAAVMGVLIGLPVLRLKGDYLAIITLGLGEVIRVLANNLTLYTNGSQGTPPIKSASVPWLDALAGRLGFSPDQYPLFFLYFLVLIIISLIILVNIRLDRSRIGRAWIAIRDDEVAAQAMGIPLMRTKLIAFATGASFAGIMGMIFAAKQAATITPESFVLNQSIGVLSMVILGGMGSIPGVILGAAVVTLLNLSILPSLGEATANMNIPQQVNPAQLQRLVFGVILVVAMLFRPEGLLPNQRQAMQLHEGEDDNAPAVDSIEADSGQDAHAEMASPGLAGREDDERTGGVK